MIVVRILGSLLLVAAAVQLGNLYATKFTKRRLELKDLGDSLDLLETEVFYGATPLPQALRHLAGRSASTAARLFSLSAAHLESSDAFPEAWKRAVGTYFEASCLHPKDKDALVFLGDVLGTSDRADQSRHLKAAVQRVRHLEADAERTEAPSVKLWRSVGLLGGLALAVLLL